VQLEGVLICGQTMQGAQVLVDPTLQKGRRRCVRATVRSDLGTITFHVVGTWDGNDIVLTVGKVFYRFHQVHWLSSSVQIEAQCLDDARTSTTLAVRGKSR